MKQIRIPEPDWSRNLWSRIKRLFTGLDDRVTALEHGGGGGGGGEVNVIESISLNGTDVPPDTNKNVALAEADPTVPAWAKATSKPTYTAAEVGALSDPLKFATADLDEPDNGVTGTQNKYIRVVDKNNVNVAGVYMGAWQDGSTHIYIDAYNRRNNQSYLVRLGIRHNKDGTSEYTVNNPSGFRSAIDVYSTGEVDAIFAGDYISTDVITPNSGVTVYWQRLRVIGGHLYTMELRLRLDSAMTGRVTLGTINSSYSPGRTFNIMCPAALTINGTVNTYVNCFIAASNNNLIADYNGSAVKEIFVNTVFIK